MSVLGGYSMDIDHEGRVYSYRLFYQYPSVQSNVLTLSRLNGTTKDTLLKLAHRPDKTLACSKKKNSIFFFLSGGREDFLIRFLPPKIAIGQTINLTAFLELTRPFYLSQMLGETLRLSFEPCSNFGLVVERSLILFLCLVLT